MNEIFYARFLYVYKNVNSVKKCGRIQLSVNLVH